MPFECSIRPTHVPTGSARHRGRGARRSLRSGTGRSWQTARRQGATHPGRCSLSVVPGSARVGRPRHHRSRTTPAPCRGELRRHRRRHARSRRGDRVRPGGRVGHPCRRDRGRDHRGRGDARAVPFVLAPAGARSHVLRRVRDPRHHTGSDCTDGDPARRGGSRRAPPSGCRGFVRGRGARDRHLRGRREPGRGRPGRRRRSRDRGERRVRRLHRGRRPSPVRPGRRRCARGRRAGRGGRGRG